MSYPKKTYSDKLKDPRWQKKRLEILERDQWQCTFCCDNESTLHVHHLAYSGEPWDAPSENLIALCEDCHAYETENRKAAEQKLLLAFRTRKFNSGDVDALAEAFSTMDFHVSDVMVSVLQYALKERMNDLCDDYFKMLSERSRDAFGEPEEGLPF